MAAGTKSLGFALVYQAPDRTLGEKEIEKAHQKIEGRLRHVLKAQIRGKDAMDRSGTHTRSLDQRIPGGKQRKLQEASRFLQQMDAYRNEREAFEDYLIAFL